VVIDHRSDIYSLGATLYELLTLEPVFNGRDREELLRQIAFEEPQRPRRLRRAIPAELETIVLKSLEKNPQDRYGTAQELANDLRCFLEYRPIKARRPSLLQRGRRWALRHRAAVGAAALVFLVAFVALAVSTVLIWEEKEKTKEALAESETNRKLAQKNAAEAQAKRQRAENNFRKGLNGMTKLANELRTDQFPDVRRITLVRNKLSARVLKFAQRFINETSTDPGERHETAGAYVSIGTLYRQQGESAKAKQAFEKAAAVFQKLVKDYPTDSFYWLELGHAHVYLASHLETMGLKSPALVEYRNNVRAFQTACRLDPKNIRCMNNQTWSLIVSQHLEMRDPEIAFEVAKRAVDRAPTNPPTWHNLGRALYYQKDWKGALHALEKALRRTPVATSYDFLSLAMTHWEFGNKAEARQWFDQGVGWIKKNEPYDAPLLLLQAEAAGLLGVEQRQTMEGNVISLRKE
jgi:tetratricopeptide (TPR) repeat protein